MRRLNHIFLIVIIVTAACSPGAVPTASDTEKYKEDLSYLRPTYGETQDTVDTASTNSEASVKPVIIPNFDVTDELNAILDSIDVIRKDQQFVDGFTIQVYSGGDSEEATKARGRVYSVLEGAKPSLKFEEPNFKVKVGKYYSRLEAQKDYALIKRKFSSALIIPERIYIQ
ncbi:MAG: hypothetical protein AAGF85_00980 [Bacteroidota bacterium]